MGGYSKDHIVILDINTDTYFSSILLDFFEELFGGEITSAWVRYIGNADWFESKRQARQFIKEHRDFFRGKYIFLQEV
jgi:hypothetical protein